ncbi:hypothetical protein KAJ27_02915 [bacterium]|nr:hypothetical protein [bacterium]
MKTSFNSTIYCLFICFLVFVFILSGCDTNISDMVRINDDERMEQGSVKIGITNMDPSPNLGLSKSSKTYPDVNVSRCKVRFREIKISDNGINWYTIVEQNKTEIDLATIEEGREKIFQYPEVNSIPSGLYTKVRLTLDRIEYHSNERNFTWEADDFKTVMHQPVIEKDYTISLYVNQRRTSALTIFFDLTSDFNNILLSEFSFAGYSNFNLTMFFIPYIRQTQEIHGVWTTGDLWGYYKFDKKILLDRFLNPIGNFTFDETIEKGKYTMFEGYFNGVQGELTFLAGGFSGLNERAFFLGNNNYSGLWFKDYYQEWGSFYFDDFWPDSKSGIIYDRDKLEVGKITLDDKKVIFKQSGSYLIERKSYNGFTNETGIFILR